MLLVAEPTDFWGIVIPGWIGAIGGLIGGVVAVVSLLIAIRSNEKASAARAAEAVTRSVVIDTIAELRRSDAEQLTASLAVGGAHASVRPSDREEAVRARHAEREQRYEALLRRLQPRD